MFPPGGSPSEVGFSPITGGGCGPTTGAPAAGFNTEPGGNAPADGEPGVSENDGNATVVRGNATPASSVTTRMPVSFIKMRMSTSGSGAGCCVRVATGIPGVVGSGV